MKEYLERPELVAEYNKKEDKPTKKKYIVPVWISGVYEFIVEASSAEEAGELVYDHGYPIDFDRLRKEVTWDYGAFEIGDVETIEEASK